MGEPCAIEIAPEAMREDVPTSGEVGARVNRCTSWSEKKEMKVSGERGVGHTDVIASPA